MKTVDTYLDKDGNRTTDVKKAETVIREEFDDKGVRLVKRVLVRSKEK